MPLLATENISNIRAGTGGGRGGCKGVVGGTLGAAFNNAILCSAAVADSLLRLHVYAAPACQTGCVKDREGEHV